MSTRNSRAIGALGVLAAVATIAVTVAYGTISGSRTGASDAGTLGSVTLTGTVADGSAPGTSTPVSFTAANQGGSPIRLTTVHLVGISVDGAHAACETADFTMGDVTEQHQVPAEAEEEPLPNDGSLVYANTAVSQDACKGATLTLALSGS